ncbi:MAG: gamma-glutamyltransferase [Armatimonadetes bacterium]|nr:gamma-glutamyltransferase [Armatimonadota bacterium]
MSRLEFHARSHAVVTGHYLATIAAHDILDEGGNAVDAAAAASFCLTVLEPHQNGLGGECPVLVHINGQTYQTSGQGFSPRGLTLEWFQEQGIALIPGDGLLPATVPSLPGTWLFLLRQFGTMPLGRILEPAIDLAEHGFAVYGRLAEAIEGCEQRFREQWPFSASVYLTDGRAPKVGQRVKFPELADTLRALRNQAAARLDRVSGLQAAYDWFYSGPCARIVEEFCRRWRVLDSTGREHGGFLSQHDMARWKPALSAPVSFEYRGVRVAKCGPWTQGPVFLQQLALLQGFDLRAMPEPDYWHTVVECARLAFADREAFYGDPDHDKAPISELLSDSYNADRRALIGEVAAPTVHPGNPDGRGFVPDIDITAGDGRPSGPAGHTGDTTHLDVVDRHGNCVSATPSGGWLMSSPVIPGLGFALGTRGQMFYLDSSRSNCYAPHKRPRATLSPSMAFRDGRPWLVFGTPGGDGQAQWTLQAFLNIV